MSDTTHTQAVSQVESIVAMVAALECDFDQIEELENDIESLESDQEELMGDWDGTSELTAPPEFLEWEKVNGESLDSMREELAELKKEAGNCADQEDAQQRIQDHPLSVEYRSGWSNPGEDLTPEEFRVVLCTGGPHVEIVGDLNRHGEPASVRVLYRDWGTSGELFDFDHDAVLTYCAQIISI